MKKNKLFFISKKNSTIFLSILLCLLFILFIYICLNCNIFSNIENYEGSNSDNDILNKMINCNYNPILTCGEKENQIINGSCYETYGAGSKNPDNQKYTRCIDLSVPDRRTAHGNSYQDMVSSTCQIYNSKLMNIQDNATYDCTNN